MSGGKGGVGPSGWSIACPLTPLHLRADEVNTPQANHALTGSLQLATTTENALLPLSGVLWIASRLVPQPVQQRAVSLDWSSPVHWGPPLARRAGLRPGVRSRLTWRRTQHRTRTRLTTANSDEEVFLVPLGDDEVLAVPVAVQVESAQLDVSALVEAVGPLVTAVLKRHGAGGRIFELSPESQHRMLAARRDDVGPYFRGVLRDADGRISHQLQLREVHAASAPSGLDALAAVQMAAIQAQLSRIEDSLGEIASAVSDVVGFLEVQQRSRVEAALQMLRELHDRARQTGSVTGTDWQRLIGVELDLETQLRAVTIELARRLGGRRFGKSPKSDAQEMQAINPERVAGLVKAHRMLVGGLRGWNEILMLRKYEAGELTEAEVTTAKERLMRLEAQQQEVLTLLRTVITASEETTGRGVLHRLLTDGLVVGGDNDKRHIKSVESAREGLIETAESATAALMGRDDRKILSGTKEDSHASPAS